MNKTEFVKDFSEFYAEIRKEGIEVAVKDIATLYAIYRKDLRTDRINGKKNNAERNCYGPNDIQKPDDPGKEPATERQKHYLMDLAYKKGLCITQRELDKMTREQASRTIDALLEGD